MPPPTGATAVSVALTATREATQAGPARPQGQPKERPTSSRTRAGEPTSPQPESRAGRATAGVGSASEQPARERSGISAKRTENAAGVGSASEQPARERSGFSAKRTEEGAYIVMYALLAVAFFTMA